LKRQHAEEETCEEHYCRVGNCRWGGVFIS
jgi:hypothetical protein